MDTSAAYAHQLDQQDELASLQEALDEQGTVGGDSGTRQSCRFLERQMIRNPDEAVLMCSDHFGEHAVDVAASARRRSDVRGARAVGPAHEKRSCDAVSDLEPARAVADRDTSPAPSDSGTWPFISPAPPAPYWPRMTSRSRWLSEVARTRTSTWPVPDSAGRGTDFIARRNVLPSRSS